jgi:hypothetical protein
MTTPAHKLTTKNRKVDDLRPHPRNARNGDTDEIAQSLATNGQYRPIVTTTDGTILAGNHTYAAAVELGWPTISCVVLDLDPLSDEAIRIMLADNRTADLGRYDDALLLDLLRELPALEGTGYDQQAVNDLARLEALRAETELDGDWTGEGDAYTAKITSPIYEPTQAEPPAISELTDGTRAAELSARIRQAELDPDVEAFLLLAAHRHRVFNYRAVAEFYAHAGPEVQRLMEESALVIVDLDDAIRDGYARLTTTLDALRQRDEDQS